jgi:hypothetical protein
MNYSSGISMEFTNHIGIRVVFFGVFVGSCRIQELVRKSLKTLAMVDEYSNNPWDESEERFSKIGSTSH